MAKSEFKSNYIIDIDSNIKNNISKEYIHIVVKDFLAKFNIDNFLYIESRDQITHLDFKNIDFSYFYEIILSDIVKKDNLTEVKTKVFITLDSRVCDKFNEESGRYYNTLSIGGCDLVYFILFTLEEIYDYIYQDC